jgi:hypothetical protein
MHIVPPHTSRFREAYAVLSLTGNILTDWDWDDDGDNGDSGNGDTARTIADVDQLPCKMGVVSLACGVPGVEKAAEGSSMGMGCMFRPH